MPSAPPKPHEKDDEEFVTLAIGVHAMMVTRERDRKAVKGCNRRIAAALEYLETSEPTDIMLGGRMVPAEEVRRLRPQAAERQRWACRNLCRLCDFHGIEPP